MATAAAPADGKRQVEQRRLEMRRRADIELDERIAQHEAAKRASPAGADTQFSLVRNSLNQLDRVPDLSPHWVARTPGFVPYLPPGAGDAEEAEAVAAMVADAEALAAAPHKAFWSTVLFEPSFPAFFESFLRYFPRPWESSALGEKHKALYSRMLPVLLRLWSDKESATEFISPQAYATYVKERCLLDVPKIVDACSLYGCVCQEQLSAALGHAIEVAPHLWGELESAAPVAVEALSVQHAVATGASQLDAVRFVRDSAASLVSLVKLCQPAAHALMDSGILTKCPQFFDELCAVAQSEAGAQMSAVLSHAVDCLVGAFCGVFGHAMFGSVGRDSSVCCARCLQAKRAELAEGLLSFLDSQLGAVSDSSTESDCLILAAAGRMSLPKRLLAVSTSCADVVDPERLQYFSMVLGSRIKDGDEEENTPPREQSPSQKERSPQEKAMAEAALASQVLDLFPDADMTIVCTALREKGNNVEAVISDILDGKLSVAAKPKAQRQAKRGDDSGNGGLYFFGKKPLADPGQKIAETSSKDKESVKKSAIAAAERMSYEDEYDDSFDEFTRYGFQDGDGEALEAPKAESSSSSSSSGEEEGGEEAGVPQNAAPTGAAATGVGRGAPAQRGRGGSHRRAPHEAKSHFQKDRAMRKRNKIWS